VASGFFPSRENRKKKKKRKKKRKENQRLYKSSLHL
jgi:hypothetical protein